MPPIHRFPDPRLSDPAENPDGIIGIGGDLHPDSLRLAYSQGIFPWPIDGLPLCWFCPPQRAIVEFDRLHIPRSLERMRKKQPFRFSFDQAFDQVIDACAEAERPGQPGTWITPEMLEAYKRFHREGDAHSVEAWDTLTGELMGGVYGVESGGAFAAESMFYRKPYASKLALLFLIEHLRSRGATWMDIQVMTPHMEAMGAREIQRDAFLDRLRATQERGIKLFP